MGKRKTGRRIDGVFLLDKPQGLSSNAALQRVRRLYDARKAGHTGALDPLATGLLPICLGEATKFSQFLLDSDKEYLTTARLGVRTDTSDAEGQVLEERSVPVLDRIEIEQLLVQRFMGEITQVPSMFSALKHQGQPLYKLARKGEQIEVKPRTVQIYELELLDLRPMEIDLRVRCSKGTYIRSLVEDLGFALGCGAHVSMLRRTAVNRYEASEMLTLEQLEQEAQAQAGEGIEGIQMRLDQLLLPPWSAVGHLPELQLSADQTALLLQGRQLLDESAPVGLVRVFGSSRFLGLAEVDQSGVIRSRRLLDTSEIGV